jgi:purine-binding chemotaxis protein CheW
MSGSNQEGRNQKLVIDYLEALLSDSDDSIIEVSKEVEKHSPNLSEVSLDADQSKHETETVADQAEAGADEVSASIEQELVQVKESDIYTDEVAVFEVDLQIEEEIVIVDELEDIDLETAVEELQTVLQASGSDEGLVDQMKEDIDQTAKQSGEVVDAKNQHVDENEIDSEIDSETQGNDAEGQVEQAEILEQNIEVSENSEEELKDQELVEIDKEVEVQLPKDADSVEVHTESIAEENIESDEVMLSNQVEREIESDETDEISINCLIVLMYGLKLAIPFEQIEGHIRLSNVTLSIDNDRDWILGDFTSLTMRTHIVDTAQMLFGDNYDPLKSNYNEMLVLQGKHWSIVFDKVIGTKNIKLSDVAENASPQFRPWLTGTYMPEKCALVNVTAMVKMFDDERNGAS